jgi:hypothetical protein
MLLGSINEAFEVRCFTPSLTQHDWQGIKKEILGVATFKRDVYYLWRNARNNSHGSITICLPEMTIFAADYRLSIVANEKTVCGTIQSTMEIFPEDRRFKFTETARRGKYTYKFNDSEKTGMVATKSITSNKSSHTRSIFGPGYQYGYYGSSILKGDAIVVDAIVIDAKLHRPSWLSTMTQLQKPLFDITWSTYIQQPLDVYLLEDGIMGVGKPSNVKLGTVGVDGGGVMCWLHIDKLRSYIDAILTNAQIKIAVNGKTYKGHSVLSKFVNESIEYLREFYNVEKSRS